MGFWKNLLTEIDNITKWIVRIGTDALEPLKSIDEKLTPQHNHISNEEPIKDLSETPVLILPDNEDRQKLMIQNIGTEPCYIKLGEGISLADFHFVLAPDTSPAYGNGGSVTLDKWHGEVYGIANDKAKIAVLEY